MVGNISVNEGKGPFFLQKKSVLGLDVSILPIFGTLILAFLATAAFMQTSYWRNNLTLWTRSLESTEGSTIAYINLGATLYRRGEVEAAEACFFQALEVDPEDQQALYNPKNGS